MAWGAVEDEDRVDRGLSLGGGGGEEAGKERRRRRKRRKKDSRGKK